MAEIETPPLGDQLCFDLYAASRAVTAAYRPALAELDVRSGSGRARSELPVLANPEDEPVSARVRTRTGSGDVVVHAAHAGPATG